MKVVPASAGPQRGAGKPQAFIVGVDKERKAPGLKALGLDKEPTLAAVLANKDIALPFKATRTLPTPSGWVILVGTGDPKALTQEKLGALSNGACRAAAGAGCRIAMTTLVLDTWKDATAAQAVTQGAIIGSLDFDQWKSKPAEYKAADTKPREMKQEPPTTPVKLETLQVLLPAGAAGRSAARAIERASIIAEAVNDSRLLSNTPANIANPVWLAGEAALRGKQHGFKVAIKDRATLRKEGFHALCGVAQGSVNEERLVTMTYDPPGAKKGKKTLVVVGKGVCFDSGGISIKPGDKMWEMKYDKIGACNTIALMTTLKALGVKHRVIGIVAAVENLPSGTAQRPGDIVVAKDGTTIEVLNTDAEGRLILADAIAHARTFDPTWIIDMATLTGACDYAVGPTYVAVMGNDDAFAKRLVADAMEAGDKAWQLPQGEEFDEANKGAYADLQNISLTIRAGTSIGGSFLKHFAKDTKFAHLDIASKAWTGGADYFAKGPTAAGLRIVLQRILAE
ncbi:MAG TPA: M17 family peptidase N-terminal domain-containing protein [Candidatus Thermoplasmatota archaeon]|nr:M17 family peptidase N-terminal domain-containing protein [Candidatus Thermoplasmatota archaeon]